MTDSLPGKSEAPPIIKELSAPAPFAMTDEWWQYARGDHFWFQWRFAALCDLLEKFPPGGQMLEIGCGNCVVRDQFEEKFNRPVHGCDLNLPALKLAKRGLGELYFYNIHDRKPEWKGRFDTILMLDTLEHIPDTKLFLESTRYMLKPGGQLVINVPAMQWLYSGYDRLNGHTKRYNIRRLRKELIEGGFQLQQHHYWGFTMLPVLAVRKMVLAFTPRDQIVARGFQPQSAMAEKVLRFLMACERKLLKWPPVGGSLSAIARAGDGPIPPITAQP